MHDVFEMRVQDFGKEQDRDDLIDARWRGLTRLKEG